MAEVTAEWKAGRRANLLVALMDGLWDDWMEWKKVYSLVDLSVERLVVMTVDCLVVESAEKKAVLMVVKKDEKLVDLTAAVMVVQ